MNPKDRDIANIVLVGLVGTGKTAVGTRLAEMLHMRFVDTDDIIEEDSNMIISDIFSQMGEEHFRDLESRAAEKASNLSIPLYVRADNGNGNGNGAADAVSLKQAIANWQQSSMALRESMDGLFEVLEDARVMGGGK